MLGMRSVEWTLTQRTQGKTPEVIKADTELRKTYCELLVEDNYWFFLVWYIMVDQNVILITGFEWIFYFCHFWI